MSKSIKIVNIYPFTYDDLIILNPKEHLENLIKDKIGNNDEILEQNSNYKDWIRQMPPVSNLEYIKRRQECDQENPDLYVSNIHFDFKNLCFTLPVGQILFHGGDLLNGLNGNELVLDRYLSTTLDPCWALSHSYSKLFIITIKTPNIKFYAYGPVVDGYSEAEILIEKGVQLFKNESYVLRDENNDSVDVLCVDAHKV